MATVSGQIVFDRDRSSTISAGDTGIANVAVVLQNIATGVRLVVLTDNVGNYTFTNVPNGNYRIVEAYGTIGGVPTPGDFSTAVVGPIPTAATPPISFVSNPPIGSTNLDCTTPNTLLITVTGADIVNQNILNGAVIYTPIQDILDPCASVSSTNLITDADNGTFGFFAPGTPANTGPATEPYPGIAPDFTYVVPDPTKYTPIDGEYTIQNIMNNAMSNQIGAWWRIADHTTGNETGRMMIVNGYNPGAVFFRSTVPVTPNTNYLFSTWILNLFRVTGYPPAQLGVRILDQNNNILYQATLGELIPENVNAPEWKEIGTIINSQNNTLLTVEFFSEGEAVVGNDYAIDDVSLREISIPEFTPIKTINTQTANVGDIVTYSVRLTNTCSSPLTNAFFRDIIPNGLVFVPGSVVVNGIPNVGVDPNIGFSLPDIAGGTSVEVTFEARVEAVPNPNPINNIATINYSYTPVEGGIPNDFSVNSNPVPVEVITADLAVIKTSNSITVSPGEELIYNIEIINNGPFQSENVVLTDSIPPTILNPEYSLDGGLTFIPWTGSLDIGTLGVGEIRNIIIRGTVSQTATGVIINTAVVTSSTLDPNPDNNTSTVETDVSGELADVSVVKRSNNAIAVPGEVLSYTIEVSNYGPSVAQGVLLRDDIPPTILNPEYSVDGGLTFIPWTGSLNIGTLGVGEIRNIIIRGTVSQTSTGVIINTAVVSSTTLDPNLDNNTSTVEINVSGTLADISVVKRSNNVIATPGEILSYTIEVSNYGPSVAQGVVLRDDIPSTILNPEYSLDGGITFIPWTGSLDIGTLGVGDVRVIIIRGTVSQMAVGTIINTAIVSSTTLDPNPDNNTSTVEIGVNISADLLIIKTAIPNSAVPGTLLTYAIEVVNLGPSNADYVVISDNIPSTILNPEYSLDGGVTFTPWTGSLNIGTLYAGGSLTIFIQGTVSLDAVGYIVNTATVTSPTHDPDLSNNVSTITTPVNPQAGISIIKVANSDIAIPGEELVYNIEIFNEGPSNATNVVLTDNTPVSILNPEYSLDGGITFMPWTGILNIGTVLPGQIIRVIIRGLVSSTATGNIINTAEVSALVPGTVTESSTVTTPIISSADISVIKTSNIDIAFPGQEFSYTIEVSNNGPSVAQNVTLIDNIPESILSPEYSIDGGVTFMPWTGSLNIGILGVGEVVVIIIRGIVWESATGTIINTAIVSSSTPDPNPDNNTSTVETPIGTMADVSVEKLVNKVEACVGETLEFTIIVSNLGVADAERVVLIDNVTNILKKAVFSVDNGATFRPWNGSFVIGRLPAGSSIVIIIRGIIKPTCDSILTNIAEVTSRTPDSNYDNNIARVSVTINNCYCNKCGNKCCNNCCTNKCCNDCCSNNCCCNNKNNNCCSDDFC